MRRTMLVLLLVAAPLSGVVPSAPAGASGTTLTQVRQIAAGANHTCALLDSGAIRCWGGNDQGQLGDGTFTQSSTPVGVVGISNAVAITAGWSHTCATLDTGRLRCWGDNSRGQLGDTDNADSAVPVAVVSITDARLTDTGIDAGNDHTCVVRTSGPVNCWGDGGDGRLGNGTTINYASPVPVSGISGASAVAAGGSHSCAKVGLAAMKCWGSNSTGQLGDGTTTSSLTPVSVSGLPYVRNMALGAGNTCVTLTTNEVRCWGLNYHGELGNGTTTDSSVPVTPTPAITTATSISASVHTCAALSDQSIRCWGFNGAGELGNGTLTSSSVVTPVVGLSGVDSVAAGNAHTCAALTNGGASCWGFGREGQLGNTTGYSPTPISVTAGLCQTSPNPGFVDVPSNTYFTDAVWWLIAKSISSGTSAGHFTPNQTVTRAQMAVFLWQAAGQPPADAHDFVDIPAGSYYSDAVSWLVQAGITSGTSPGHYSPNQSVTRSQMAMFLWRATGELPALSPHGFGDIPSGAYYGAAVSWLVEAGITSGTAPGTYSPNASVTRAQMAVFLHSRGCG